MMNFIFTGSKADQKYDFISCVLLKRENMVALTHRKGVIYHIVFYIPGPIQTFWLPTKALSSSLNQSTEYR